MTALDAAFSSLPPSCATALGTVAAPLRSWFVQRFGSPTAAQRHAWPVVSSERHLLLSAPTGSGKTLAAFLPILGELMAESGVMGVRCLYVAPLKALVADVGRNLRSCLEELKDFVPDCGLRVASRTGDSTARARKRLRVQPPYILLTTPESLALLLSQAFAANLFGTLRWLVIDEIHALAANKRGADLSISLERAEALAERPLQRIGLSATCAPLSTAAQFLVGNGRSCMIAQVAETAPLDLRIEPLEDRADGGTFPSFFTQLLNRLEPELTQNRATLVFTNTRGLAERLVWSLRRRHPGWAEQIAAHHSSLAASRRREVERQLKLGRLRVVVTSTSLELGIDIGSVDGVVLVHPPGGVVRLLQRVGRAGHAPGQRRRGLVLTASAAELLEATVTAAASQSAQCELLRVPSQPLDVLCQQLCGMAAQRPWSPDEAFALVRRAYPFRDLNRRDFDDCLDYLSGWQRDGEPCLPARLRWDGTEFMIADQRTARLLRRNLGTILADEPRPVLRDAEPPERIGHVDETFADRLQPGDRFLLDGRCLEFRRVEKRALMVEEVNGRPAVPRWEGHGWPLSAELANRLFVLRGRAAEALREGPAVLHRLLREEYGLGDDAALSLVEFFQLQECVSEIPDPAAVLVEEVASADAADYYVHTPLNRTANDALARVAVLRLSRQSGQPVLSLVADLGFLLSAGAGLTPDALRELLALPNFDADLQEAVADSLTLRERFRCVALTGLMVLRNPLGGRRRVGGRDWEERRLFEQVRARDPDFALLRQARREVCAEALDAVAARSFCRELPRRAIQWRRLGQVSPFAGSWTQATPGPLATVEGPAEVLQRLHAALMGAGPISVPAPA